MRRIDFTRKAFAIGRRPRRVSAVCGVARPLHEGAPRRITMLPLSMVVALAVGVGIVALLLLGTNSLAGQPVGRVVLLVGLVALPLLLSAGNVSYGVAESSQ